jgi:hypothetical protein
MKMTEFSAAVKRDREALGRRRAPPGLVTCKSCRVPLQESRTGMRPRGDGTFYCSDCYFDAFSKELDKHPISAGRSPRGA